MMDLDPILRGLTVFAAVAILISGLDDLFIDVCYYAAKLTSRTSASRRASVTEAELAVLPEQRIAVMIPAWQEDAVIARMLRNTLGTVQYRNFDLFVGTYPNDEPTMRAVREVAADDPRVHLIVVPHDGPTNKADCLNSIVAGIRSLDAASENKVAIFMLHDSEDLVHPLSFRLMNRFIPGAAMVQLPVIPFEAAAREMTAGTYLDEFAESHVKDMVVREHLSGMVPSAGVGTGFARGAIDRLAVKHGGQVFNTLTFTEDYDLAFRLKANGENSILVQFFSERELVGTRGFFPTKFRDAVRQKSRWTLGIVFHGWQQRGWEGNLALRYMIWRDRKALVTNAVNVLGYLLLLSILAGPAWAQDVPGGSFAPHGWVMNVIWFDGILLLNRCVQRAFCITQVSSWKQAALSMPRIVWGNVINFSAVVKASTSFARSRITGRKAVWLKTAHAFPTAAQLLAHTKGKA